MDSLPPKPSGSRGGRNRDKDQTKKKDESHRRSRRHDRDGDKDKDKDRDRNHNRRRRRRRSTSPTQPSSKRPRTGTSRTSHKGKEPARNGDIEPGEIKVKQPEIGDDFIPLGVSDTEASPQDNSRSERARQKEKAKGREWDVGKPPRVGDEEGRGTKRKYDYVFDEEDVRAYSRRERFEPRRAPWVSQVDWDSCYNVAEM